MYLVGFLIRCQRATLCSSRYITIYDARFNAVFNLGMVWPGIVEILLKGWKSNKPGTNIYGQRAFIEAAV